MRPLTSQRCQIVGTRSLEEQEATEAAEIVGCREADRVKIRALVPEEGALVSIERGMSDGDASAVTKPLEEAFPAHIQYSQTCSCARQLEIDENLLWPYTK